MMQHQQTINGNLKMLETQIKTLNANIEKLNDLLTEAVKLSSLPTAAQDYAKAKGVVSEPEAIEQEAVQPEPEQEQAEAVTREMLQANCLRLVRDNRDNKAKIKEVLSGYGVATITKLADKDVAPAHVKINEACE